MTQEQIEHILIHNLSAFSHEEDEITVDSVPNEVINSSSDQNDVKAKDLFKGFVKWSLVINGHGKKNFRNEWLSLPLKEIAQKLLILMVFLLGTLSGYSQLEVNLGAAKTDAKNAALNIGITYAKSLDSVWNNSDYFYVKKNSFFTIAPEIDIQTGNEDAFSSMNFNVTGQFVNFKTKEEQGLILPKLESVFHVFPISLGVEASNSFNTVNTIAQVGWVPWYQTRTNSLPKIVKATKIGIWVQGGYKFHVDSTNVPQVGGQVDESKEAPNTFIARVKGNFGIDTKELLQFNGLKVGVVGNITGWADVANSAFYRSIDIRGRFYLTNNSWIDLIWQKGSVAPLFNKGTQAGVGATIKIK